MLAESGKNSSIDADAAKKMALSSSPAQSERTQPCSICGGTQWVSHDVPVDHPDFGKLFPCSCQQADLDRARKAGLRISRDLIHLKHLTFETFQPEGHAQSIEQRRSLQNACDWAARYANEARGWLLILGGYGVGKTHLAAAIANARFSRGQPVTFLNVPDLLDYLRAAFNPNAEETYSDRFAQLLEAPLLILDDLGTQNATAWAEEKLFQLLNHRYIARLPTVITTNQALEDLDPRLSSRLADMDLVRKLPIDAPDFRRGAYEQEPSSLISLEHYYKQSFDTFDARGLGLSAEERHSLKRAAEVAREYAEDPRNWLALFGAPGCGKTHLAAAIANHRVRQGYSALLVVVPDLLDHLRATFSPESSVSYDRRFEEIRTAPLLILDDLGTESATPWAREKLYQIVNYRYVAQLPTVITSNSKPDELDLRIGSRIFDETHCSVIPILAPSYRGGRATGKSVKSVSRTPASRKRR
jgi:DNA replication protein DnaC